MRRSPRSLGLLPILAGLLAGTLLVAGPTGCGGGGGSFLTITVNPDQVPADGKSTAKVSINAVFQKAAVADGTQVNLTVSAGSFDPTDPTVNTTTLSTTAGSATVKWYPPQTLGDYKISGSFTDDYQETHQAEAPVQVVAPPPVDGASFKFSCAIKNLGVPPPGADPVIVPCHLSAKDVNGQDVVLNAHRFHFLTEAGTLQFDPDTGALEWVVSPGDHPKDVQPMGDVNTGEPRWTENTGGITHNPRDGIATLVVWTMGKPDAPQDALHGEPYVDANDNGTHDTGEQYYDADGNGAYTGPSGAGTTAIWRWVKVLMTGPVDASAPAKAGLALWHTTAAGGASGSLNVNIKPGQSATIGATLLDENLNPVASQPAGGSDTMSITVNATDATVAPDQANLPANYSGLTFDPDTGALNGASARATYLQNQDVQFRITNTIDPTVTTTNEPWSIDSVTINRTPYPNANTTSETLPPSTAPSGILCHSTTKCP